MKRRKFLSLAGGAFAVPAITAPFVSRAVAQQAGAGSITVTGISSFRLIEDLIPRFTQETGIAVDLQILPYPQLRQRAMADLVGGTANSDVYLQDIIWLGEWAKNQYVRPLDDLFARDRAEIDVDDILPGAFSSLSRWEGKIWSIPFGAYYFLNFMRTDWFREKNLNPPVTLADVDTAAQQLTDARANRFGISMAYQRGGPICSWFLATYAGAGGKLFADAPNNFAPTLESERAVKVLEHYVGWLRFAPQGAVGHHWNDQTAAMQSGRLGMAPTFTVNGAEFMKRDRSVIASNLGFSYMPKFTASENPVIPFGGWAVAINARTQKVEPSWKFLKWVMSKRTQLDLSPLNGTPVRYSALQEPALQQQFPWFDFVLRAERENRIFQDYRPRYPFYPEIEDALGLQLNRAALNQARPAEALALANRQIADIVRNAGFPVR